MTMRDHKAENASMRGRVLRLLWDLEWHSFEELQRKPIGGRYSARLLELENDGFRIERAEHGKGKKYRLLSRTAGRKKRVLVKVFLEAKDVEVLLRDQKYGGTTLFDGRKAYRYLTARAERTLRAALDRYEETKRRAKQ
jgi:hypothetical protein